MPSRYVTFNPLRSIGIPFTAYIKPDHMYRSVSEIVSARQILFPEYWQVNALVYALKKKIFPSAATYHLGHDKIEITRALTAACPDMVPRTGIFSQAGAEFEALEADFGLPFVCKEVRSSSGLGVFLIKCRRDFEEFIRTNPVVYVQQYLEIHRDLRVVVVGDAVVSAYWRNSQPGAFHNNLARGGTIDRNGIPDQVLRDVAAVARNLGINHAGFDVAVTETGVYILEFNPFFGTRGTPFSSAELGRLIYQYLESGSREMPGLKSA